MESDSNRHLITFFKFKFVDRMGIHFMASGFDQKIWSNLVKNSSTLIAKINTIRYDTISTSDFELDGFRHQNLLESKFELSMI